MVSLRVVGFSLRVRDCSDDKVNNSYYIVCISDRAFR
jgi:hypothetical protein